MVEFISGNDSLKAIATVLYMLLELWLGRTSKVKSGSFLELLFNVAMKPFKKEKEMQVGKLKVDLEAGKVHMAYNVGAEEAPQMVELVVPAAALLVPAMDAVKAKVEAGQIDPIKNTDMDKEVLLRAIDAIKAAMA